MVELVEGMSLYHGSYTPVTEIDLDKCRQGKDFGRGFYVTTSPDQARSFALLSARKHADETGETPDDLSGHVSEFTLKGATDLASHEFPEATEEWLHFVAGNRRAPLFPELLEQFRGLDVIIDKIANDQTARTLQLYVTGAFGAPGSQQADDIAIAMLLPNRLENQLCFKTNKGIAALSFSNSEVVHG